MKTLFDSIFTNTSLELSPATISEIIKQENKWSAKLIDIETIEPETIERQPTYSVDVYNIYIYMSGDFQILNTETKVRFTYRLIDTVDISVARGTFRELVILPKLDVTPYIFHRIWQSKLFFFLPPFEKPIAVVYRVDEIPANLEESILGTGIYLLPLKDEGKLYGYRVYVEWINRRCAVDVIVSKLAEKIPNAEDTKKPCFTVELDNNDPLLKHHSDKVDIRRIAALRGWAFNEIHNGNLIMSKEGE